MAPKTMFEKIWDAHVVRQEPDQPTLLYVDLHLVHEVTSAQAFDGLRQNGRKVRRVDKTVAVADHNVPTDDRSHHDVEITDETSRLQLEAMERNTGEFGIEYYDMYSPNQGIVHVIAPEQGRTQPGMVIVCGDSHTSTHGAFGSLAFGIGTSEVEHVLATQCLLQAKPKSMEVRFQGPLAPGCTAKDMALAVIGTIGTAGGTGHVIEYTGEAVRALSMEGRMTLCNMTIEAGARAGMIAPDQTTFDYVKGRDYAPRGAEWDAALERWRVLPTDEGAGYDELVTIDASGLKPHVTWGTNPGQVVTIDGTVPTPSGFADDLQRQSAEKALAYMGLAAGTPIAEVAVNRVFIGSCTNSRIEDLRAAAAIAKGYRVHPDVYAMVVPGSTRIKLEAEAEGLDRVFTEAGFDWRAAGCSMCLGMNPDILAPGERSASTSNRNFEGRQGPGGRTHLVSPAMAAAAAIEGHFTDVRDWEVR